jgi:glycosyltransferase involved in cell wall biosynthesis
MKIGVDATPLSVPRAGVGTYTANLIRALRELGGDEVVPLLHRDVHPAFTEEFRPGAGFRGARGLPRRLNRTVWMQTALRRRIRSEGFDVCHFTNSVAPLRCACPYVVTIHDAGLWLHPEYHYLRRLLALRPLIPPSVHGAAAVVTVSHSVKEELIEVLRLPEFRVRVIYQGVSRFFAARPSRPELERVRERHGLPERFVLAVGALEPRKNLVRLLEAYTALATEPAGRGVGLVIVGPAGWKNQPILDTVSRMRRRHPIFLLEPVSTEVLVALYHLAAVLAFPSLYEGFGLPLVEAMTCGTPVVTSWSGAMAEVAGDAAELVDPLRVDSIAEGLLRVLADEERATDLRTRGLLRARDFSWTSAARETRALYAEVSGVAAGPTGPGTSTPNGLAPGR